MVGERHPDSAPQGLRKVAQYLSAQFSSYGWKTTSQHFRAWGKVYRNILAVKNPAGRRLKDESAPLIIGAHYDTVVASPGADDNASALTVLLEAACELQRAAVAHPVWLVAFCLEEQGLLGSQAFVSRLKKEQRQLAGAIILECVGFASHKGDSQRIPPGVPIAVPTVGNFLGIIGNEASQSLVDAVGRSAQRILPELPTIALSVPARGEALPDVRRSDHAAFWDEGYPAVMLTDTANFRNPHYHLPTDTVETLNLAFLESVADVVVASVRTLAMREAG